MHSLGCQLIHISVAEEPKRFDLLRDNICRVWSLLFCKELIHLLFRLRTICSAKVELQSLLKVLATKIFLVVWTSILVVSIDVCVFNIAN